VSSSWLERRLRALRTAGTIACLGLGPLILGAVLISRMYHEDVVALDFHHAFYPASKAILEGVSPYPQPDDDVVAQGAAYVYPPLAALVLSPLTLLSGSAASTLMMALLIALVPLTLWVLDVRDWRCYGAALLWGSVGAAVQTANLTLILGFVTALLWRYRERVASAAALGALAMAAKMFLWPLAVWLIATRRSRQACLSIGVAVLLTVASWGVIGFAGLRGYPALTHRLTEYEAPEALTLYALGLKLGLPSLVAKAAWLCAGVTALVGCIALGRRDDDERAFVAALGAALLLSPIVWLHYLALLLVPLSLTRREFGFLWVLPVLLWAVPADAQERATWQIGLSVVIMITVLIACVRLRLQRRPVPTPALASGR
jgi:alpha-1,2-mannosyltransferase